MESTTLQVKVFVRGKGFGVKPAELFEGLEADVNAWLEANPNLAVEYVHQLSRPSFDWGQLAVAVWYSMTGPDVEGR